MEPVPVTRRVRRTVRMAVALVVGQAMLCALIGWLTLGRHRSEPSRPPGSAVVDQLAAPPLTGPVPAASRSAISSTAQTRKPAPARPSPRRSTADAVPRPVVPEPDRPEPISAPPEDPPVVPTPPTPPTPPAPSPPRTSPPDQLTPSPQTTPSPSGAVQEPVRVGDECDPVGSFGRTAEGELVRCVRDWRHGPRWKIV
ncbi:hypothetical protein JIG36_18030 [Actinoplanes sp. LDG1-06]|uniref:Uncharacterized protein n=1 Tax=Paractinoplanes ovalisporus TaxID=2810368 RepID=A0ABS2ACD8_9ACTN|nr:hypothetical protein [Actinoplanes ovalisporus]MBM2617458.1 hypothetical protein [Actinoplanes ovalisporus]